MPQTELKSEIKMLMAANLMLQISPDEIGDETPLFGPDGLGLDSIDALELVVSLEKAYGVKMPDSQTAAKALASVNAMANYVTTNRLK